MFYREWLEDWLEYYVKVSTKERTYNKYKQQIESYILPILGNYEINRLSATVLQKFSVTLNERGLAANTANGIISVLKSSLKKAVALGIADKQYSDCIARPKIRERKVICFSKEEQRRIENYIFEKKTPKLFGIILCLYTGLRIGELLALEWDDIDFKTGILTVTKSCHDSWKNNRYVKAIDTTKTNSSERIIPVPKLILGYLKSLKKQSVYTYIVAGKTEYGMHVRTYQRIFESLLKKLGIDHKGFHALRHTFATRALEVGMDVKTLSEILGHKSPTITLQRYVHSMLEHKTEMMNKLGRLLH